MTILVLPVLVLSYVLYGLYGALKEEHRAELEIQKMREQWNGFKTGGKD